MDETINLRRVFQLWLHRRSGSEQSWLRNSPMRIGWSAASWASTQCHQHHLSPGATTKTHPGDLIKDPPEGKCHPRVRITGTGEITRKNQAVVIWTYWSLKVKHDTMCPCQDTIRSTWLFRGSLANVTPDSGQN